MTLFRPAAGLILAVTLAYPRPASSESYRLRGQALSQTRAPSGLLVLGGETVGRGWIEGEALVWAGANDPAQADVLVAALKLRDPLGYTQLRMGRVLIATGVAGPMQMDGLIGTARLGTGTSFEAFVGQPVVPRFGERDFDWTTGGRIAQSLFATAALGLSYVHTRNAGRLANEEVGLDAHLVLGHSFALAARAAYDLPTAGLADLLISGSGEVGQWRFEGFISQRDPSRILPATSLFSVISDYSSQQTGASAHWKAAPRLDLSLTLGARRIAEALAETGRARAHLRLNRQGSASIAIEAHRAGGEAGWTGLRTILRTPLVARLVLSAEAELVRPDDQSVDSVWPWGLVSLSWHHGRWQIGGAFEASRRSSAWSVDALGRVAWLWRAP